MTAARRRITPIITILLALTAFAGCFESSPSTSPAGAVREIRMWVEPISWELHPNVETPVWAFCAEGDGVQPVHGESCGVPGPTIRVTKGDTIRLTFENTHTIPHTVHFHGWHKYIVDMNGNGLVHENMVVAPGETKLFEWVAEPAGTFIYHCHYQTPVHMEMGMSGAFIVEDPAAEKPDKEFVAVLDEWALHDEPKFNGNIPAYNFFTMNGKSFPLTQPWIVEPGDHVRIHLVDAGYEFHAFHIHGYTPDSWEGVAGPKHAVPTDVREIAPGQSVVLDFIADREGVWLAHDHVVPRVTAGSDGNGFGAYPRGMLTALIVGSQYAHAFHEVAPVILDAAGHDMGAPPDEPEAAGDSELVPMKDFTFTKPELRVPVGTTVVWANRDNAPHTVTADDASFDSGDIAPGSSWRMTFAEPGTYTYHCTPHSVKDKNTGAWKGMVATVLVE